MDFILGYAPEKAGLKETHANNIKPTEIIEEHSDIYNHIPSRDIAAN